MTLLSKLSKREKQVLIMILNEQTTSVIAERLAISVHTVETHRKNIFKKAGVTSVVGLVKLSCKQGII